MVRVSSSGVWPLFLTLPFDLGRVNFFYHHDDQTWARRFPRVEWPMSSCRIPVPTMNLHTGLSVVEVPRCDVTVCSRWLQPKDTQHQPAVFAISQTCAMPNADYNESVGVVIFGEPISAGAVASRSDLGQHLVGQSEWAEVIRGSDDMIFPPGHEGVNGYGCWFFPAIGSGIWVNTGNTLQLRNKDNTGVFGGGRDIVSRWLQMHSLVSEQNFTTSSSRASSRKLYISPLNTAVAPAATNGWGVNVPVIASRLCTKVHQLRCRTVVASGPRNLAW